MSAVLLLAGLLCSDPVEVSRTTAPDGTVTVQTVQVCEREHHAKRARKGRGEK